MDEEVGRVALRVLAQVVREERDRLAVGCLVVLGDQGAEGVIRLLQLLGNGLQGLGDDGVLLVLLAVLDVSPARSAAGTRTG